MKDDKIYFGYFKDFNDPTILFSGSSAAFVKFSSLMKKCENKEISEVRLEEESSFVKNNIQIILHVKDDKNGMKKISDKSFEWVLDVKQCGLFAKVLDNFSSVSSNGAAFHQYLECDDLDDVVVMISFGEYNDSLFAAAE